MKRNLLSSGLVLMLAAGATGAPAHAEDVTASYEPGKGFSWATTDGRFKLGIGGRLQLRYTFSDPDGDRGKDDVSDFTAQRIRFHAKGHLFDHWEYKFQADWGKGDAKLKDALINYAQFDQAQVQAGQFKVHFDQQQYISSAKLQFVDRSLAAGEFGIGRDVGLQLHGEVADAKLQYAAGVFDGEGENGRNENDGHLYAVHVGFHPKGDFGYHEGGVKRTDESRWFISLAAAWNEDLVVDLDGDGSTDDRLDDTRYTAGFGFRHDRFSVMGEYYMREEQVDADSAAKPFLEVESDGWYLQFGVMLFEDDWELAMRYSEIDWDEMDASSFGYFDSGDTISEEEVTLAISRYFRDVGHALKVQGDISWLEEGLLDRTVYDDLRVRLQAQIVF